jgi:hypothetical protein
MSLKYKIGCDPEFSILYDGKRVGADNVLNSLFKGHKDFNDEGLQTEGGEFGCDGCASTGELRPKPALEPKEVTENIRKCFKTFFERRPAGAVHPFALGPGRRTHPPGAAACA